MTHGEGSILKKLLELENVDSKLIKAAGYRIAIDCVNSVGGIIIPELLRALGVETINGINTVPDGNFAHNPEPLPENLGDIARLVVETGSDLGFVVDPDVDRLAIVCEDGSMFGEEYTLVSIADYVLETTKGSTVSNLSSTRALRDVAERHGCTHYPASVGEVNVVEEMKRCNAVIGGEGNGGVIFPALHYGRDALAGIALFLTHLSKKKIKCSELRKLYPDYYIAKKKLRLDPLADFRRITAAVKERFAEHPVDERDGLWIGHPKGWVQIRKSNTEPIMRIYAEAPTQEEAVNLADTVIEIVKKF
jgi:phosphomannomutase